jgi:hypothetical protein
MKQEPSERLAAETAPTPVRRRVMEIKRGYFQRTVAGKHRNVSQERRERGARR